VDQSLWEKSKWEDANKKDIKLCNWFKKEVCINKRKNLSLIQRRERRSEEVYSRADEEVIYLTVKVTQNAPVFFVEKKYGKKMVQDYQ